MKVELPNDFDKTVLKEKFSKNAKAKMQRREGQSMPMVSQRINEPRNMKRTPMASLVSPSGAGTNLPKKQRAMQIGMMMRRYILLSFNFMVDSLSQYVVLLKFDIGFDDDALVDFVEGLDDVSFFVDCSK